MYVSGGQVVVLKKGHRIMFLDQSREESGEEENDDEEEE
jgi:hypothetical protein